MKTELNGANQTKEDEMPIFKGLYKGNGIYWHGKHGYGDETIAYARTIAEYKAKIDARIKNDLEARPAHEKWRTSIGETVNTNQNCATCKWVGNSPVGYKCTYFSHISLPFWTIVEFHPFVTKYDGQNCDAYEREFRPD